MTDSNYTHIGLLVDRSGSIYAIREDAEGAINQFVKDQKAQPGRATLTLVQFDTVHETLYENADLQDVGQYTLTPRGATALLDAWGQTVTSIGEHLASLPEDERPGTVIVVIETDGKENASKDWTLEQVKELTKRQTEEYGWKFIFLAANQDAVQVGATFGVDAGSSLTYGANAKGTRSSFAAASGLASQYRGGNKDAAFNDKERADALGEK